MADDKEPQQVVISSGVTGLVAALARIVVNLSSEKALTLFVCAGFGWMLFSTLKAASEDKAAQARNAEDARERDRQFYTQQRDMDRSHCDAREDKRQRDKREDDTKLQAFFAAELEKGRAAITELTSEVGKLRAAVQKLEAILPKKSVEEDPCPLNRNSKITIP